MPLPLWVRARALGTCDVFQVVPGQRDDAPWKELRVYDQWGAKIAAPIREHCAGIRDYYLDWARVVVDDVSHVVPAPGWRDADGHKRSGNAAVYAEGDKLQIAGVPELFKYNRLAWNAGAAVVAYSDCDLRSLAFRQGNAGAIRSKGKRNRLRNVDVIDPLQACYDMGAVYVAGRHDGPVDFEWVGGGVRDGVNTPRMPQDRVWGLDDRPYQRWAFHADDGASGGVLKDLAFDGGNSLCGVLLNGGTDWVLDNVAFVNCPIEFAMNGGQTVTFLNMDVPQKVRFHNGVPVIRTSLSS